jgi:hypothetical protein
LLALPDHLPITVPTARHAVAIVMVEGRRSAGAATEDQNVATERQAIFEVSVEAGVGPRFERGPQEALGR